MSGAQRPRALVTAAFRGEGLEQLRSVADIIHDPWTEVQPLRIYGPEQVAERIAAEGANIFICESDFCSGPVFDLPLLVIGSCRGDPSNVDVAGATAKGIPVLRAPGRNADGVAEMTIALLMSATRHVIPSDQDVRNCEVFKDGTIPYLRYRAWQVAGQTAGIIGLGAVGRAVKWRLEGLGMKVISYDPFAPDATHSLDDLLAESDVVTIHAAPLPETIGMMNEAAFSKMKDGAVYLNSARAGLHDLDALVKALSSGKLSCAGLDHFEGEQLPSDHPLIGMSNVVLTPHIGGATYDTEANHSKMIANDVALLLAGERPINIVNPEVLK